jgi:ABC-2 type transport system permease protein
VSDWLASYRLLLLWQVRRYRHIVAMIVIIQVVLGLGIVYGLAFLIPHIDPRTALFLSTGAPTLALLIMGLNVVPQEVAQDRLTGAYDYMAALPVPRLAALGSYLTYWFAVQLPGTVLALAVGSLRFHFHLSINPLVVPAFVLVALSGAVVGYAMASVLRPEVTSNVTAFVTMGILLFSPLDFPITRLPGWLQVVHRGLPIKYMADLIRWSVTGRFVSDVGLAFAVVGAWCVAGLAITYRVATRRR